MIVNEIAKFENPLHDRWSACEYPSSASRRSSSDCCCCRSAACVIPTSGKGMLLRPYGGKLPAWSRQQRRQDVLGPAQVVGHDRHRGLRVALVEAVDEPRVLRVRP